MCLEVQVVLGIKMGPLHLDLGTQAKSKSMFFKYAISDVQDAAYKGLEKVAEHVSCCGACAH